MNIFYFKDYRLVLKKLIEEQKLKNSKLNYTKLATGLGIQKTYISKVINGTANLNSDQIYLVANYFDLSEEELEFLLLLLELERSGIASRKQELIKKITYIQSQHRSVKKHLTVPFNDQPVGPLAEYYLDPFTIIVNIFLTIPYYQKKYMEISQQLQISEEHLKKILRLLEICKAIEFNKSTATYKVLIKTMHLPKESPLCAPHQYLFRLISSQQIFKLPVKDCFSFQVAFSADEKVKNRIHERFLEFLKEMEKLVVNSENEKIYQFNCDLFPWCSDSIR